MASTRTRRGIAVGDRVTIAKPRSRWTGSGSTYPFGKTATVTHLGHVTATIEIVDPVNQTLSTWSVDTKMLRRLALQHQPGARATQWGHWYEVGGGIERRSEMTPTGTRRRGATVSPCEPSKLDRHLHPELGRIAWDWTVEEYDRTGWLEIVAQGMAPTVEEAKARAEAAGIALRPRKGPR